MIAEYTNNLTLEEKEAIAEIFTQEYYQQTYDNGVPYGSHLMLRMFRDLGVLDLLKNQGSTSDEIIAKCNFIPGAKLALEWMLAFLQQGNYLDLSEERGSKRYCYKSDISIEPEVFLQKGLALDNKILPTSTLMEYVISEYPNFFYGRKKGFEILFAQDKISLWGGYFSNENSSYRVYNSLGALGVCKWAPQGDSLRILEVGGGTGGASVTLLEAFKEKRNLSQINEYVFSDVSPIFLRLGNRAIMNRAQDDFNYALKRLDFEKSLVEQGVKADYFDVVYGVNTLHVAKDLNRALRNIHEVIKPGGIFIISEYCRPGVNYLLLQEFIFNLLDNYVNVNLDSKMRPQAGFLDFEHWRRNLEAVGFKQIEAMFNCDGNYPPELSSKIDVLAAVIKAQKP